MNLHSLSTSLLAVLACALFSCKKNHAEPSGTMTINFSALRVNKGTSELIISEPGGKILLDELSPFDQVTATLKTDKSLVDVTMIDSTSSGTNPLGAAYYVRSYMGVDPGSWTDFNDQNPSMPVMSVPEKSANILFKHFPVGSLSGMVLSDNGNDFTTHYDSDPPIDLEADYVNIAYRQHSTRNYLYFLLPIPGLYKFHLITGLTDTVDLAQMDTVVKMNFRKPSNYVMNQIMLTGFPDTTNYDQSVMLYDSELAPAGSPDLEYPGTQIQKMELYASANDAENQIRADYYSFERSIPTSLPFPEASSIGFPALQPDKFSAKVNAPFAPSYYISTWKNSKVGGSVFYSPDVPAVNLAGFLSSLKSKLLKGQSFSDLKYISFQFGSIDGLDYPSYSAYVHNLDRIVQRRAAVTTSVLKSFQ